MTYNELKNYIVELVYNGVITIEKLPEELFLYTYLKLRKGIDKFFGKVDFENPDWEVKYQLASNVYLFSGAKTYKNIWDLQKAIMDNKGYKRSWSEFQEDAFKIFDTYNVNWLEAEFETAFASAQQAAKWQDIWRNRKELPLLKYQTVGDERVRPSHQELDGIVRPVEDSFWNNFYPPNGFRCRCTVIQLAEDEEPITEVNEQKLRQWEAVLDPLFKMNSGKHKYIFDSRHTYFNANTLPSNLRTHFKVMRTKQFGFDIPLFFNPDKNG